jgi:A118 family predicted phage portal protein
VIDTKTGNPVTYFDPSDEAFIAFNNSEAQEMKIIDNTVEIRIESIRLAIQTLLNILSVQVGFSAGYLSFDAAGLKTATEVISENSKTYKTKQAYENNIGAGMLALLEAIRVIGPLYGITTTKAEYSIAWNDAIIEDRAAKEKRINERVAAGTMTKWQAIMELDGLTEAEARARADEINKENATIDVGFGGL